MWYLQDSDSLRNINTVILFFALQGALDYKAHCHGMVYFRTFFIYKAHIRRSKAKQNSQISQSLLNFIERVQNNSQHCSNVNERIHNNSPNVYNR